VPRCTNVFSWRQGIHRSFLPVLRECI
jgi:hypothetical protein